jgi:hypothetical protein
MYTRLWKFLIPVSPHIQSQIFGVLSCKFSLYFWRSHPKCTNLPAGSGLNLSPHVWSKTIGKLYINICRVPGNRIHKAQILQRNTVLILHLPFFPAPLFMIKALWNGILIAKKAYLQGASNGWLIDDHNPQLSSLPWSRRDDCDACVSVMKREEFRGSGHIHVLLGICSPNNGDVGMPRIIVPSQK